MKSLALILLTLISGCSSYSIKGADGSTLSGSLLNGSASYSSGAACTPAVPSPTTPIPQQPIAMVQVKMLCDSVGKNCNPVLVPITDTSQSCQTKVVNVRGTDPTTIFAMLAAALGLGVIAAHAL